MLPALAVEQSYCAVDKEKLLLLREQELKKLEEEVLDIEVALGLHINELAEQCINMETALFEAMEVIWDYQKIWNGITDYSLIEASFIRDEYQATFLPVALCACSELKFQEFNSIIAYYNSLPQNILQKSSNIYSIFQDQIAYNESSLVHIKDCKNLLSNIQSIDEDYLKGVECFNIQLVNSLQKQAQTYVSEKENVALVQAKKKKESMKEIQQRILKESCVAAGRAPDPDDEEWKKKHPHGRYEENPKHHQNSRGNVSKPPRDGQAALDNSIEVPGRDCRVSIQDNQIVMLQQHRFGRYHGYIVEDFKVLHRSVKNALYEAGLIKDVVKGKMK